MGNDRVAEDMQSDSLPEIQPSEDETSGISDENTEQQEIDFDIDFEDDLGPSLEEVLEAATRDANTSQESDGDAEENENFVESEGEGELNRHWYVVHCYSGYENKVCHNLEQRIESMGMRNEIFDVVVPTEEEIAVKDGKRKLGRIDQERVEQYLHSVREVEKRLIQKEEILEGGLEGRGL